MIAAALLKNVLVRLRDISSGGCLIESRTPLPVGTTGLLDVEFDGERRVEWFRICRTVDADDGDGLYVAGAEFLPFAIAGRDSLRGEVGRRTRRAGQTKPSGAEWAAGRLSGDSWNSAGEAGGPPPAPSPASEDFRRNSASPRGKVVGIDGRVREPEAGSVVAEPVAGASGPREANEEKKR